MVPVNEVPQKAPGIVAPAVPSSTSAPVDKNTMINKMEYNSQSMLIFIFLDFGYDQLFKIIVIFYRYDYTYLMKSGFKPYLDCIYLNV